MSMYLEQSISIVFLRDILDMSDLEMISDDGRLHLTWEITSDSNFSVIVVSYGGRFTGLVVDKLLHQQEIMEKALPSPLNKVKLLSGTTILGNGKVCPVLDIPAISDLLFDVSTQQKLSTSGQ